MIAVGREPALGMLRRFVEAAGWQGEDRRLLNAAPHLSPRLKLQDFITTLENFGAGCRVRKQSEHDLRPEDCPCLFCDEEGILLILERRGELSLIMEPGRPPRLRPVMRNIGEMISIAARTRRKARKGRRASARFSPGQAGSWRGWFLSRSL